MMKKLLISSIYISILFYTSSSLAAIKPSQLVGTWKCVTDTTYTDKEREVATTLDDMRKDGTMTQYWEVVHYDKHGDYKSVEFLSISNRWSLKKDTLFIFNWNLNDYYAFDNNMQPVDDKSINILKSSWQKAYANPYDSKIIMVNKNEYHDADEVPNDEILQIKSGCVRIVK